MNFKTVLIYATVVLHPRALFLQILSSFRRVRKIAKSDYYLRHVRPSVRPHGTTRLPLKRIFMKFVEKIQVLLKSDKNIWYSYFTWRPIYIFYHISLTSS